MQAAAASKATRWRVALALGLLLGAGNPDSAPAGRITNEPKGFNGYIWGAPPSAYPALKPLSNLAAAKPLPFVEVYENPGETLTVNDVTLFPVHYRFYKGRLWNIQLWYEGRKNREKLMQWVEDNYGRLPAAERKQKQVEWHSENAVITLEYDRTTDKGRMWFIYLEFSPFDNATTDTTGY